MTQLDCLTEPDDIIQIQWAADTAGNDAVIGIDARIVVPGDAPDALAMRSADRLAHSLYDKYHAGPSSTNLSLAVRHRTTRLSSELANLRFLHGDQLTPQSEGRHQIEVHPPAASVQLFLLARVIRYRRGTIAERKEGLRLLRGLMLDHFPRLFPRLALTELPEVPSNSADLKALQHRLDSLMSAYVAAHWWYWGRERNDVLGDAANGYIVVPRRRTADLKLADLREELTNRELLETGAAAQPVALFKAWLGEAYSAGLTAPNAMTLATVGPDGKPSARIVLLDNVSDPCRRVGVVTGCGPNHSNSGRAARINCMTGCSIRAGPMAGGRSTAWRLEPALESPPFADSQPLFADLRSQDRRPADRLEAWIRIAGKNEGSVGNRGMRRDGLAGKTARRGVTIAREATAFSSAPLWSP